MICLKGLTVGHVVSASNWCLPETFWAWAMANTNYTVQPGCTLWSDRVLLMVSGEEGSTHMGLKTILHCFETEVRWLWFPISHLALLWTLVYPFSLFHQNFLFSRKRSHFTKKKWSTSWSYVNTWLLLLLELMSESATKRWKVTIFSYSNSVVQNSQVVSSFSESKGAACDITILHHCCWCQHCCASDNSRQCQCRYSNLLICSSPSVVKGIFLAHYVDCRGFTLPGSLPFPFSLQLPLSLKAGWSDAGALCCWNKSCNFPCWQRVFAGLPWVMPSPFPFPRVWNLSRYLIQSPTGENPPAFAPEE